MTTRGAPSTSCSGEFAAVHERRSESLKIVRTDDVEIEGEPLVGLRLIAFDVSRLVSIKKPLNATILAQS